MTGKAVNVRPQNLRRERSISVLALAVLVHAVLGFILACHLPIANAPEQDQHHVVFAPAAAISSDDGCPGCLLDEPRPAAITDTEVEQGADIAPCPPQRPCQHRPAEQSDPSPAVFSTATARDVVAVLSAGPASLAAAACEVPVSVSGPVVSPAVLSPVAVLCVDRN